MSDVPGRLEQILDVLALILRLRCRRWTLREAAIATGSDIGDHAHAEAAAEAERAVELPTVIDQVDAVGLERVETRDAIEQLVLAAVAALTEQNNFICRPRALISARELRELVVGKARVCRCGGMDLEDVAPRGLAIARHDRALGRGGLARRSFAKIHSFADGM